MAARPWEHADQARAALSAIVADPGLGVAALCSGTLAANALEDLLPDAPRERAVLVMAAKAALAQALLDHIAQGLDAATAIGLTSASFEATSPLDPQACRWVVTELAVALGLTAPVDEHVSDLAVTDTALADDTALAGQPGPEATLAVHLAPRASDATRTASVPRAGAGAGAVGGPPAARPTVRPPVAGLAQSAPRQRRRGREKRDPSAFDAAFSPDGQLLAIAGSDGTVRLRTTGTGALASELGGHAGKVRSVSFSPDGRLLATAGEDDAVRLWEVISGALMRTVTPAPARYVAFSPDARWLATAGGRTRPAHGVAAAAAVDGTAWLWDVASGAVVTGVAEQGRHVGTVAFSPDGRLLATAGAGDVVRLWEIPAGRMIGSLPRPIGLADHVAFSPDGRLLATAGAGNVARLWDATTGQAVRPVTQEPARDVAFSPDGVLLATAGGGTTSAPGVAAAAPTDKAAWLWEVATGTLVSRLAGHDDAVQAVTFSPVAGMLATCSRDRTVRLWNLASNDSLELAISS